jgi:large subunit ribosomal protein L17
MRHRIAGRKLTRTGAHRRSTLRNLAAGVFEHGSIETTLPMAKAVQPLVEKIITIAKRGGLQSRRLIESKINDRMIHAWVADPNVPDDRKDNAYFELPEADSIEFNRYGELRKSPRLVQHIMTKVAPMFADRDGGYTRIIKLAKHRLGDGSDLVALQLVGTEEGPEIGGGTSGRRKQADKRTAFAAKLRKADAKGAKAEKGEKRQTGGDVGESEEGARTEGASGEGKE